MTSLQNIQSVVDTLEVGSKTTFGEVTKLPESNRLWVEFRAPYSGKTKIFVNSNRKRLGEWIYVLDSIQVIGK